MRYSLHGLLFFVFLIALGLAFFRRPLVELVSQASYLAVGFKLTTAWMLWCPGWLSSYPLLPPATEVDGVALILIAGGSILGVLFSMVAFFMSLLGLAYLYDWTKACCQKPPKAT